MDFLAPLERFIYGYAASIQKEEMNWKQHLKALLTINMLWFVYAFSLLIFQDKLPLNPDGNPGQTPDLAFNTAISFLVNCNLQHYSGESGLTYFTQLFVITFLQFVSAATGLAALLVVFKALRDKTTTKLGNFWDFLVKINTRLLLLAGTIVMGADTRGFNGTPASLRWQRHHSDHAGRYRRRVPRALLPE